MRQYFILAFLTMTLTGGISSAPKIQAFNVDLTLQAGQVSVKTWVQLTSPMPDAVCIAGASDEYGKQGEYLGGLRANSQYMGNGNVSVTMSMPTPPAAPITAQVSVICTKRTQ